MHRNITYRLIPGTRAKAQKLSQIAGACRWVWNRFLAENRRQYQEHVDTERFCEDTLLGLLFKRPAKPSLTFYSLGKRYTRLHHATPWLQALPFAPVRYVLKYQADAWKRSFADPNVGFPKFKARMGDDSFTIPQAVKIRSDTITGVYRLWIPKVGWCLLKRSGGNPYEGCLPVQAVIKRVLGRWYCTVCYDAGEIALADNGRTVGLDRNAGQVTASDGRVFVHPNIQRLEARKRRYQRMMSRRKMGSKRRALARYRCAKTQRKIAMIRADWQHHVSRALADQYGTVILEALNTRAMTRKAKRTLNKPGTNVKAKARLNRVILATGWAALQAKLVYKCSTVIEVQPAYTSQQCSACGHTEAANRRSQAEFECVACGHRGNADVNAALNIQARGTGAAGRRGALALATPMTRQRDMQGLAA